MSCKLVAIAANEWLILTTAWTKITTAAIKRAHTNSSIICINCMKNIDSIQSPTFPLQRHDSRESTIVSKLAHTRNHH
jgi:hypothetical protein